MERFAPQPQAEGRLSDVEVQAVLARLRSTEPDMAEESGSTVEDLAEASGVSPDRITSTLAQVREERVRELEAAAKLGRKRHLRTLALSAAALAATATILNVPISSGDPVTVAKVETRAIEPYVYGGGPAVQVDVTLDYHPRTIWHRLVGPNVSLWYSDATINTPVGPMSLFYTPDGNAFGVHKGPYLSLSSNQAHMSFAYPARAGTKRASAISQPMTVDGQPFELLVPLR